MKTKEEKGGITKQTTDEQADLEATDRQTDRSTLLDRYWTADLPFLLTILWLCQKNILRCVLACPSASRSVGRLVDPLVNKV